MTRKQRRASLIGAGLVILAAAVGLVLTALQDNIVFFYSPSDIAERGTEPGERLRLGGLVAEESVTRGEGTDVRFDVTDFAATVTVTYSGTLPDLFREGQGVVTQDVRRIACEPPSARTAFSLPTRCSPSTMKITCPRKSPTR